MKNCRHQQPIGPIVMLTAVMGCASPVAESTSFEPAQGTEAAITFPAAAYANARAVTYGSTTTLPFLAADGFVAIKFMAAAGDNLRFTATAARATRSYLVRNRTVVQVLQEPSNPDGSFRYTVPQDGEYFVMIRSDDRAALSIAAKIELLVLPPGAAFVTNQQIVDMTPAGKVPLLHLGQFSLRALSERRCNAVSGCVQTGRTQTPGVVVRDSQTGNLVWAAQGVSMNAELQAPPDGALVAAYAWLGDPDTLSRYPGELRLCPPAQGGLYAGQACGVHVEDGFQNRRTGSIKFYVREPGQTGTGQLTNFRYDITWTPTGHTMKIRSEHASSAVEWTELYEEVSIGFRMPAPATRMVASALPPFSDVTVERAPIDDEAAMSLIPPGSGYVTLMDRAADDRDETAFYNQTFALGGAGKRICGPRTGCTAWDTAVDNTLLGQIGRSSELLGGRIVFPFPTSFSNDPRDAALQCPGGMQTVQARLRATSTQTYAIDLMLYGPSRIWGQNRNTGRQCWSYASRSVSVAIDNGRGTLPANGMTPPLDVTVTREGLLISGAPYVYAPRGSDFYYFGRHPMESGFEATEVLRQRELLMRFNRNWPPR